VRTWDHGDGHVSWFAVRGKPKILFNVHLDTVPAGDGWSRDPFELQVRDDRAIGRGACDIKGAAAVLLTLAGQGPSTSPCFSRRMKKAVPDAAWSVLCRPVKRNDLRKSW
jgi:hypothetical protein